MTYSAKIKVIAITFLLLCFFKSFSQKIIISGVLFDSINSTALPYGTVSIDSTKGIVETNVITNCDGEFKIISKINRDTVFLICRYVGYKNKYIIIDFSKRENVILGKIMMVPNHAQIEGIVIQGEEKTIIPKFDRTVYKMNKTEINSSMSVLDLLRDLPGVTVDEFGNIRYKGAKAVIFIDEQPIENQYPSIEIVPVDRVKTIELIDASMYTGGDGKGGVINIVMKPIKNNGLSGLISTKLGSTTISQLEQSKLYLNMNYKKGKLTYFLNSSLNTKFTYLNSNTDKEYTSSTENNTQNILDKSYYNKRVNYNNIGIIFRHSSNSKLVARIGYYTLDSENENNLSFIEHTSKKNIVKNKYKVNGFITGNQVYKGINISYRHKLDTLNTYFKLYGSFNTYGIDNKDKYKYNYILLNRHLTDSTLNSMSNRVNSNNSLYLSFFINYSLSKNTRWNLSYYFSSEFLDTISDNYYVNSFLYLPQSKYDIYNSQNHNLSFRIGTKLERWKIDGGIAFVDRHISGKYTRFLDSSKDTSALIKKNYYEFLPSVTIGYTIGKTDFFKFSLSKNANFPYYNRLVNFVDKQAIYNWKSGNLELNPVYFYGLYVSYLHMAKKWNSKVELFYHYTNNEVEYISIPINSLTTLSKPENISQKSDYGVDFSFRYKFSKLMLSVSSTFYYLIFDISSLQNMADEYSLYLTSINKKRFGYKIRLNAKYEIKGYYSKLYFNYNSLRTTYNGYIKPKISTSFNISRKYFSNHLAVSFGVYNIFNTILESGSYSEMFNIKSDNIVNGSYYYRTVYFSIQYSFNKGDRGTKKYRIGN